MKRASFRLLPVMLMLLSLAVPIRADEPAKPVDGDAQVKKFIADGGYWYSVGQYEKAQAQADEALKLKPDSAAAKQLKEMSAEGLKARAVRRVPTEGERERQAAVDRIERDMAVPREPLRLPDNWAEVKKRTGGVSGEAVDVAEENREINAALDATKVSADFNATTLKEAAAFLANLGGLNIQVDPRARAGDKPAAEAEVTFKAQNIKLRNAIAWLTRLTGLSWTVRDQVVFITDREHLEELKVTAVYDIRDIVTPIPDYASVPDFDMTLPSVNARRISDGFYRVPTPWQRNGTGVFTGAFFADFEGRPRQFMTEEEVMDLIDSLVATEDEKQP